MSNVKLLLWNNKYHYAKHKHIHCEWHKYNICICVASNHTHLTTWHTSFYLDQQISLLEYLRSFMNVVQVKYLIFSYISRICIMTKSPNFLILIVLLRNSSIVYVQISYMTKCFFCTKVLILFNLWCRSWKGSPKINCSIPYLVRSWRIWLEVDWLGWKLNHLIANWQVWFKIEGIWEIDK